MEHLVPKIVIPSHISTSQTFIDLTKNIKGKITIKFPKHVLEKDLFLVVDIYSSSVHRHPDGHIGWWRYNYPYHQDELELTFNTSENMIGVTNFGDEEPNDSWINKEYSIKDEEVFAVHLVLRNSYSEAIELDNIIYLYTTQQALDKSSQLKQELSQDVSIVKNLPSRWFCWNENTTVHIVANNIFAGDAISNFAFNIHKLLINDNIPCQLYAHNFDPQLLGYIKHVSDLITNCKKEDILFLNFSIYEPYLGILSTLECRKICYYHNITPPKMFQVFDAEFSNYCSQAYEQIQLLKNFDILMSNSNYSAGQLSLYLGENALKKDILIYPPIINPSKWDNYENEFINFNEESTILLFVGKIAPHKKIEDLFSLFHEYSKLNNNSSLIIAGKSSFKGYRNYLNYLLSSKYSNINSQVHFMENATDFQLKNIYERSSAFICMSEHEGFCIPLLEAMYFNKPIFAYAQEAIKETMGATGRIFYHKDFPRIAREINMVLSDSQKTAKIVEKQRHRYVELSNIANGQGIWQALELLINS
jgi:glycosyltransferase involved in cell wall biosynthesis